MQSCSHLSTATRSHNLMKLANSVTDSMRHNPLVQLWCSSSSLTVRFFLQASLNRSWNRSIGAFPFNHDYCQNLAFSPLPRVTTVLALKCCRSTAVTGGSVPTQGRSGYVHSNQSHLKRKALLNRSRSSIPNSPNCFGLIVLAQLTRQLPPLASASPPDLVGPLNRPFLQSEKCQVIGWY